MVSGEFHARTGDHDPARGIDGGRRNRVGAVAVVLDVRVGRQAARPAEQDAAREHLVGAVDLAHGQGEAALRGRRHAGGSQVDGAPEPRERLVGTAAPPPSLGKLLVAPGGIVVVRPRPRRVVAEAVFPTSPRWRGRRPARAQRREAEDRHERARAEDRRGQDPGEGVTRRHEPAP